MHHPARKSARCSLGLHGTTARSQLAGLANSVPVYLDDDLGDVRVIIIVIIRTKEHFGNMRYMSIVGMEKSKGA